MFFLFYGTAVVKNRIFIKNHLTNPFEYDIIMHNDATETNSDAVFSEEDMDDGDADNCQHSTVFNHINSRLSRA